MLFREENLELWDNFVSNKIVYFAESINGDLEVRNGVSGVNWFPKWDGGNFYLQLKFIFVGQRDAYQGAVLKVRSGRKDNVSLEAEGDGADDDLLMLVDIGKAIQLPKGMILAPRPVLVWLKGFDNADGSGREAFDFSSVTLVPGSGAFGLDGKTGLPARGVRSDERELPCELIEAGSQSIDEFSGEHRNIDGGNFLLNPSEMERLLKVVIWRDGISVVPKFDDGILELVEAYVCPTKLHLCVRKPYTQRHGAS